MFSPKTRLALSLLFAASTNAAAADLSLSQAVQLAVQHNVSVRLAAASTKAAKAQAIRSASSLLPQIMGTASQKRVFKENLEALGFPPGGGFNTVLGPFNTFDARVSLVQNILDLNATSQWKGGKRLAQAAELEENLAKEQVASAAALAYLELIRSRRAIEAAQTDANLSTSLETLANDQHKSGLATGIDVARAQTRTADGKLRLIRARKDEQQAHLRLARLIGISFEEPINTTDALTYSSSTLVAVPQALTQAQHDRSEISITELLYQADQDFYNSARYANAPRLYATGDYGLSGVTPDNAIPTSSIGANLELPIFTGRSNAAAIDAAAAAMEQTRLKQEDTQRQIEEDVRLAIDNLSAAQEEVATATQAHQFAEQEMKMARDRYAAGIGDNIQVITAQNNVAQADDDLIGAIARYQESRINFEMSIGHAQLFTLNPAKP